MFDSRSVSMMIIGAVGFVLAAPVLAQGEPTLQQAQAECQSAAQQQTGYNPNAAATTTQSQAGGRARGAAAGAMAGAVKGRSKANEYENVPSDVAEEYTRNQMEDAAKAGAAVGASRQRQERRQGRRDEKQQSAAADAFNQAYASCMSAKGFPGQ